MTESHAASRAQRGANCLRETALLLAMMSTEGRPSSERGDQYRVEMATRVAAWLAAAIFLIVAAFQAALVFGAPWGEYTHRRRDERCTRLLRTTLCSSVVRALDRDGWRHPRESRRRSATTTPGSSRDGTCLVATVYAAVAVVLNIITRSTAERALWGPVSIVLLVLVTTVMVTTRRT
jgi:hypothetical protein